MITINHASKLIGSQWVLRDINLNLGRGKIYGFQGRNGSGKTMLFRAITGLILLTEGSIEIDGKKVDAHYVPKKTGMLIENPVFLDNLTGLDNLIMIAKMMEKVNITDLNYWLDRVGLSQAAKKVYRKYSLGMKQRLGIASAMMGNPNLIILDEPTIALDDEGILMLYHLLQEEKNKGKLILISSHEKEIIEKLADELIFMKEGRIVSEYELGNSLNQIF